MRIHVLILLIAWTTTALFVDIPPRPRFNLPKLPHNMHKRFFNAPFKKRNTSAMLDAQNLSLTRCTEDDFYGKDFDVVVYGATGVTGTLAAEHLAAGHPDDPSWAIAGRDQKMIDKLARKLNGTFAPEIIIARLDNHNDLFAMTKRARVVLNYAGPYQLGGGEALIFASLQGCAHYVDISMEAQWNVAMFKKYEKAAQARGVAIVQSAGFTSLASDLLAMAAINDHELYFNEHPRNVKVEWAKLNGGISRGLLTSEHLVKDDLLDPYGLSPDTPFNKRLDSNPKEGVFQHNKNDKTIPLQERLNHPDVNGLVIRRSIHTQYPNAAISVHEGLNASVETQLSKFLMEATSPIPLQPVHGEGPSRWGLDHGSFQGTATAVGRWPGVSPIPMNTSLVTMVGSGDPSFVATAKMSMELALGISKDLSIKGGYYTPTEILGVAVLEERLTTASWGKFVNFEHEHSPDHLFFGHSA